MRVLALFEATAAELRVLGAEAMAHPRAGDLAHADAVVVESFAQLPHDAFEGAERLRWVVSLAAGAEHVPFARLPRAARVLSVHGPNADAIAEHAFALLLAAAKRLPERGAALRAGHFPQERASAQLRGRTLMVLGTGAIGGRILRLARAFGMRTLAHRRSGAPYPDADETLAAPAWERADATVLALPLTDATRGLVDARALGAMPPGATLVNVARGKLVDRDALARKLDADPEFTYATDVWWRYPGDGVAFDEPLISKPNVIGTPHVAAIVPGWREARLAAAARVVEALRQEAPLTGATVEDPSDYRSFAK